MTPSEMGKKATKAGGYFKFTGPRMVDGILTPTTVEATQRDVDTRTGEKLAETATDFFFHVYQQRSKMVSRDDAEKLLAEMV